MDDGASSKQISEMIQKFALAFKAKTYELFSEGDSDGDVASLLDSAEEFIPDQKVVVIKPDLRLENSSEQLIRALLPSIFATLASFEASYLHFQAAHVPELDQDALESVDKSLVSILQKLTEMKKLYHDSKRMNLSSSTCALHLPAASFLDYQVQENQSKLRVLKTMVNSLQSQIESKDDEVKNLRNKLDKLRISYGNLLREFDSSDETINLRIDNLLTLPVFESMLRDSVKSLRSFTKLLIELMTKASWDLVEASNHIYPQVKFSRKGHFRFAFLSYISLGMLHDFDRFDFGCSENRESESSSDIITQLIEHIASNPLDILHKDPKTGFSRFCARKYEKLIHPAMESSMFGHLERKETTGVLDSWKSLTVFSESFVRMASSVWLLHKLAHSFRTPAEIFQVASGTEFSAVYMEDISAKAESPAAGKASSGGRRVGFSVVPGFKIGKTVIQCQVYIEDEL